MQRTPQSPHEKTFQEQFVPLEQRESQNVKAMPFFKDLGIVVGLTAIGGVAGRYLGKMLEPRNIKLGKMTSWMYQTDKVDRQVGMYAGAKIGGIYGIFHHWKKSHGKQLGVTNLHHDLQTAMDPAQLEREAQKEQKIVEGLSQLETAQSGRSQVEMLAARSDLSGARGR